MAMKTSYYTVGGEILAEESGGVRTDYVADALGSVAATSDEAGAVKNTYRYKPYGAVLAKAGVDPDPKFIWVGSLGYRTLQAVHPAVYIRRRTYLGYSVVWSSMDPIPGLQRYGYGSGNPVNNVDPMGLRDFRFGSGDPPNARDHDEGAGTWNSITATLDFKLRKRLIVNIAPIIWGSRMPDALSNLLHFFGNSGRKKAVNLPKLVRETAGSFPLGYGGFTAYKKELLGMVDWIEANIGPQQFSIDLVRSYDITPGQVPQESNENWYFATHGFRVWSEACVTVVNGTYKMLFSLNFYDRYNWDKIKTVNLDGEVITDSLMGTFHLMGLAREYDLEGSFAKKFTWRHGERHQFSGLP